jgi:hypothetical protein
MHQQIDPICYPFFRCILYFFHPFYAHVMNCINPRCQSNQLNLFNGSIPNDPPLFPNASQPFVSYLDSTNLNPYKTSLSAKPPATTAAIENTQSVVVAMYPVAVHNCWLDRQLRRHQSTQKIRRRKQWTEEHYDRVLVQYSDYNNSYRNTVRV